MPSIAISTDALRDSVALACHWLADIAQIKHRALADEPGTVTSRFAYDDYRGAIKGEYRAATGEWSDFCPVWHTGQAVQALALASEVLADAALLDAARRGADFILRNTIEDKSDPDFGLILAFEGEPDWLNTSAIMEALPGLLELHRLTGESRYLDVSHAALDWIRRNMYLPQEGLIKDLYRFSERRIEENAYGTVGRPTVEDAVFLTVGRLCDDDALKQVHFRVLERLLEDEEPPGNWIRYTPCNEERGTIHPRHAYWWGLPFVDGFEETGDERYLAAATRAGEWYLGAQRTDGGLIRETRRDFKTASFGHATSGIACAVILWTRLWQVTADERWLEPIERALRYCQMVQIREARDTNLEGVIIEKILPPDGTDRSLIHIRDLGTIFFVQAACGVLQAAVTT